MKTYVVGDIHSNYDELKKCLQEVNFNFDEDRLIILGDVIHYGKKPFETVDLLLKIKKIVFVYGNHDIYFIRSIYQCKNTFNNWLYSNYEHKKYFQNFPREHLDFFKKGKLFHIENNNLYVHNGYNPFKPLNKNKESDFTLNRFNLIKMLIRNHFNKIFIGHTFLSTNIKKVKNIYFMDTGSSNYGKLSVMEVPVE